MENWVCFKCGIPLETKKVVFEYLGNSMTHELLKCPSCGNVLIPKELVEGKMSEVETMLEDK
ncbi:MAG: hypothetical protein HUJ65_03085 [Oscillospiraceae bacterium]|nr:hypothetical protein [Oscillospiraceae bacterium]